MKAKSVLNFEKICRMSQKNLKKYVAKGLQKTHPKVEVGDGYVFAQGTFPVCLVAHLDTVHDRLPTAIVNSKGVLSSPQGIGGDDRCGVYMILEIVKKYNCSVIFCEDEEIGCVGAGKFINTPIAENLEFNYMIELDRRGENDAVFYDCDNPAFTKFILSDGEWELDYGSFTDITVLAPFFGCAAVNFSCGYYDAHTTREKVVLDEMEAAIGKVLKLLARTTEDDAFEYIEARLGKSHKSPYAYPYDGWVDDDMYYIEYATMDGDYGIEELWASNEDEALGKFFKFNPDVCYNDVMVIYNQNKILKEMIY